MISSRLENGFVARFTGFHRLFADTQVTSFLSHRHRRPGCEPDQESKRIWGVMAWTDIRHFVADTRPNTDIGERTWAKSFDLYQGRTLSGHVSIEKPAQEMTASCRRSLPSANSGIRRMSWQRAEPRADRPEPGRHLLRKAPPGLVSSRTSLPV